MEDLFISLFGKPEGIILSQLIAACRFTIYLSLIAFIGGGILGGLITLLRIIPSKFLNNISFAYVWLFQSFFLSGNERKSLEKAARLAVARRWHTLASRGLAHIFQYFYLTFFVFRRKMIRE